MSSGKTLLLCRKPAQTLTYIPKGSSIVVCRLPDDAFVLADGSAIGLRQIVCAMKFCINCVLLNKLPLLEEPFEVNAVLFPVPLVHQKQCIQPFHFHPPFFNGIFWLAKRSAFAKEAAVRLVPAISKSVIDQHLGHPFSLRASL